MRVVSGKARGMVLYTIQSEKTRPTKDMVKEALFSILGNKVQNACFLDLFAGSGAIGIEAISRGAEVAYFCDINDECINVINKNLSRARFVDDAVVMKGNYDTVLCKIKDKQFDIIYIDPPYNMGIGTLAIKKIDELKILNANGIIVHETDEVEETQEEIGNYKRFDYRKYGRNILNFYSRKG